MGPSDIKRYTALSKEERDALTFEADFCMAVLKKRPYQFETLQAAANSLTALGYYEDGLSYDMRLEELRPADPLIIYNLACSLSLVGRIDEAIERLDAAITLGYRDKGHLTDDPDLNNARSHPRFSELVSRVKAQN